MPRIKSIFVTLEDLDAEFMARVRKDPQSKCWHWTSKEFRFRHGGKDGGLVFNPRRYAVQMVGLVIPPGRNITHACINEDCVNPDHAIMKHNGAPIDPNHRQVYLELGSPGEYGPNTGNDFSRPNGILSKKYHISKEAVNFARKATFQLIVDIKKNKRLPLERIAAMFNVSPQYAKQARDMTVDQWEELKMISEATAAIHDAATEDTEYLKFKL